MKRQQILHARHMPGVQQANTAETGNRTANPNPVETNNTNPYTKNPNSTTTLGSPLHAD